MEIKKVVGFEDSQMIWAVWFRILLATLTAKLHHWRCIATISWIRQLRVTLFQTHPRTELAIHDLGAQFSAWLRRVVFGWGFGCSSNIDLAGSSWGGISWAGSRFFATNWHPKNLETEHAKTAGTPEDSFSFFTMFQHLQWLVDISTRVRYRF